MLRKVLMITIIAILIVSFGCKKKESAPAINIPAIQKQVEKDAENAKEKAGQELEKAGQEIQKDANAQAQ
jgi:hypothetical protein